MDRGQRPGLAAHALQQHLETVESDDFAGKVGEGEPAAHQEIQGGSIGLRVDPERAEDAQLLVDDVVGLEPGRVRRPRVPASTTVPPVPGQRDRLAERGRGLGGDVDHDVGEPAGRVAQRAAPGRSSARRRPRGRRRTRGASASRSASRAPVPVTITKPAPASLARHARGQPADARAEHRDDIARPGARAA